MNLSLIVYLSFFLCFLSPTCLMARASSSVHTDNVFEMESHHSSMETKGLASMPNEITQMIVQQVLVEDLKNVACICRTVHEATADILRRHQALIREYHFLDIDVMWIGPYYHDVFGWDVVRSHPIISLCTILEDANLGHYVRNILYTPDSIGRKNRHERKEIINHGGALKTARNLEVLREYLSENQLQDDIDQSKLCSRRRSSDPHDQWNEEFVEHLKIDYGLYLRILLPMVPNLTTLEISWNFSPDSPICKFIRAATKKTNPFLQHLTKVKLLLGRRPHRMDIGAFLAVPSLRWLSIHHLYEFDRFECYPELVGYSILTRLELVDCAIYDADLCSYFKMFSSLQHVDVLMTTGQDLRDWTWRKTQAVDILFTQCGSTLRSLSLLNIGLEEKLKSLENFPVLRTLTLQFSSLFSLEDREPRMISQLSPSIQTLRLWNDLTTHGSEIRNRIKLIGQAKSDRGLSLECVEVATEYKSCEELQLMQSHTEEVLAKHGVKITAREYPTFEELQRWQSCIEEDLAGCGISFAFLKKEQWPLENGREPPKPDDLSDDRKWWADNKERILKADSEPYDSIVS